MSYLDFIVKTLEQTISFDRYIRSAAEKKLEKDAQTNLDHFLSALASVLANNTVSSVARQAAGIQLKNNLTSKNDFLKETCQQHWMSLPSTTHQTITRHLLAALGTESTHPSCAAQCLAYISTVELSFKKNNKYLERLLCSLNLQLSKQENEKVAAIETIGFICQEVNPTLLADFSVILLQHILNFLKKEEKSEKIRLAAGNALLNSLELAQSYFESTGRRNQIMQAICDATQSFQLEESVIGLQILVKIASFYYSYLSDYMRKAVVGITIKAMLSTENIVSQQGIEFWSTLAEIEFDLISRAYDPDFTIPEPCHFVKTYLPTIIYPLMKILINWQGDSDDLEDLEDWGPVKGAVECLRLLSKCCPSETYICTEPHLSILDVDWKKRLASLLAISAIIEEMDSVQAEKILQPLMSTIWRHAHDPQSAKVRYVSFMLMKHIFQTWHSLIPATNVNVLVDGLLDCLKNDVPRIAALACKTLSVLVETIHATPEKEKREAMTLALSSQFRLITEYLFNFATDSSSNLQVAADAYLALVSVLKTAPENCFQHTQATINLLFKKLHQMENATKSSIDHILLACNTICLVLRDLQPPQPQLNHDLMSYLIKILHSGFTVEEEILLVVSAMTAILRDECQQYLPGLVNYLKFALGSADLSRATLTLVSNLFGQAGPRDFTCLLDLMEPLLGLLNRESLELELRAEAIGTLTNVATFIDKRLFHPYLEVSLNLMHFSSRFHSSDVSDVDELRSNICRAYCVIFPYISMGDESSMSTSFLSKCLSNVSDFVVAILKKGVSEEVLLSAGVLIGLIIAELGAFEAFKYLDSEIPCQRLLENVVGRAVGCLNKDQKTCSAALIELGVHFE